MEALLLLIRRRWSREAAEAICSSCNPLACEATIGDVEAVCLWLGAGSDAASKCIAARCGRAECINVDVWLMSDGIRALGVDCRLPYWLLVETIGFQDLSVVPRRAPGPVDVYMTPTLLGQLVAVRGCAASTRELHEYARLLESELDVLAWSLYPVYARLCGGRRGEHTTLF